MQPDINLQKRNVWSCCFLTSHQPLTTSHCETNSCRLISLCHVPGGGDRYPASRHSVRFSSAAGGFEFRVSRYLGGFDFPPPGFGPLDPNRISSSDIPPAPVVASASAAAPQISGNWYSFTARYPFPRCTFHIATPISIASSSAIGRVKNPTASSKPPNTSSAPIAYEVPLANPSFVNCSAAACGLPNSFGQP